MNELWQDIAACDAVSGFGVNFFGFAALFCVTGTKGVTYRSILSLLS